MCVCFSVCIFIDAFVFVDIHACGGSDCVCMLRHEKGGLGGFVVMWFCCCRCW